MRRRIRPRNRPVFAANRSGGPETLDSKGTMCSLFVLPADLQLDSKRVKQELVFGAFGLQRRKNCCS